MATGSKNRNSRARPAPGQAEEQPSRGRSNGKRQEKVRDNVKRAAQRVRPVLSRTKTVKQTKRTPRKGGSRAAKRNPRPAFYLSPARQEEIAAVTLLGIALLTALGAFNLTRGNILHGWTKTLSILFGVGRVLAPLFFGGLGVWLLLDSLDLRPDIGWERPFGFVLVFLILLTIFHIPFSGAQSFDAAQRGEGGGLIGLAISDFMVGAIGTLGTVLILFIFLCISLILLFNIPLMRIIALVFEAWHGLEAFFSNSARAWSSRPPPDSSEAPRVEFQPPLEITPRVIGSEDLNAPADMIDRKPFQPRPEPRP